MSAESRTKWSKTKSLKQKLYSFHHKGNRKRQKRSKSNAIIYNTPPITPLKRPSSKVNLSINVPAINEPKSLWIHWKPPLPVIYKDKQLLSALFKFMQRSLNEESILFLHSVYKLNAKITSLIQNQPQTKQIIQINNQIISIYNLYVSRNAKYQINVSSDCFAQLSIRCNPQLISGYSLDQKRKIFDVAIRDIELLMIGVLSFFYVSHEFQTIAQQKMFKVVSAPIILNISRSTPIADIAAAVGTFNDAQIAHTYSFYKEQCVV